FFEAGAVQSRYSNVDAVTIRGAELGVSFRTVGDVLRLGLNGTLEETHNTSSSGDFERFAGDRLPNRPFLYGSAHAGLRFTRLTRWLREVTLDGAGRATHAYFLSWPSAGRAEGKATIPSQLS